MGAYTGWHTFGVSWSGDTVTWYYDGVEVGSEATDGFTGPHFLVLVYTSSGNPDTGLTMQCDWVRVWEPG